MKQIRNKQWIVILIMIGVIISIGMIGVLLTINTENNVPVRDTTIHIGASSMRSLENRENLTAEFFENEKTYFNSVQDVIEYYEDVEGTDLSNVPHISETIIQFETDTHLLILLPERLWTGEHHVRFLFLEKQQNQFSYPLHAWVQGTERSNWHAPGIWYDEDRIARDIVESYIRREVTAQVNDGVSMYYGVGVGFPPLQILILGHEPDNMVHFKYEEEDYFFWYYLSNPEFGDLLSEHINLSSKTLGEVIELFDIQSIRN